jgi:thiol:disulfide interchange protein
MAEKQARSLRRRWLQAGFSSPIDYLPSMRTAVVLFAIMAIPALRAAPEYPNRGPDIYDPQADGFVLINTALQQARTDNKRVLLDFGANWCPWCHLLHQLFTTDDSIRRKLAASYVVVMIDVNKRKGAARNASVNEKYGNPLKAGLPVLVLLDADGRQLVTQETGAFEKSGQAGADDPAKVLAFLEQWAPPARPQP